MCALHNRNVRHDVRQCLVFCDILCAVKLGGVRVGGRRGLAIRHEPDPVLRVRCGEVGAIDAPVVALCGAMVRTMKRARGIGLAAPQVGVSLACFVTSAPDDRVRVFINPKIKERAQRVVCMQEGCLSVPSIFCDIERSYRVVVRAYNEDGRRFTLSAEGWLARVILHEYDHLQGVLFWDLLPAETRRVLQERYRTRT